jgi:hypothetical protein
VSESKPKWIRFDEVQTRTKTKRWRVLTRDGGGAIGVAIGVVSWWSPWRKYVFHPFAGSLYEQDCLRDIATFIENATREHRARLKEYRARLKEDERSRRGA